MVGMSVLVELGGQLLLAVRHSHLGQLLLRRLLRLLLTLGAVVLDVVKGLLVLEELLLLVGAQFVLAVVQLLLLLVVRYVLATSGRAERVLAGTD